MILRLMVLVIGVAVAVGAVVLRKRMASGMLIGLLVAALVLSAAGIGMSVTYYNDERDEEDAVYLTLKYLNYGNVEAAAYHMNKAGVSDRYIIAAARSILETARDNGTVAALNATIAQSYAKSSDEVSLGNLLAAGSGESGYTWVQQACTQLNTILNLSEKRSAQLDAYFLLENGSEYFTEDTLPEGISQSQAERLQIAGMIGNGNYIYAVQAAADLVEESASADNRLLLAETIAQATYHQVSLDAEDLGVEDEEDDSQQTDAERESLSSQMEALDSQIAVLESQYYAASEEAAKDALNAEIAALAEEREELQKQYRYIYAYRAFNSIADIHTLDADLVRARLYYALQEYDLAVQTLLDAADSVAYQIFADSDIMQKLETIADAYDSKLDAAVVQTAEFQELVEEVLSAPFDDLMQIQTSALTEDFAESVVADQKVYGKDLAASYVDTSEFPKIRLTVSGKEEVLEKLVEQEGVTLRDTYEDLSYTAYWEETIATNICVLVDCSGSMGGTPMDNLRSALQNFISNITDQTPIALVPFASSAHILCELTTDQAVLSSYVSSLDCGGGTNITAGISCAIQALQDAEGSRTILLMTDGQSSIDDSVIEEAAAQDIVIYCVGFGDVNDELLQYIADSTGGQYIKADDSSELENVYASLQQIIGHTVTVEYTVTGREEDRYCFLAVEDSTIRVTYTLDWTQDAPTVFYAQPWKTTSDTVSSAVSGGGFTLNLYGEDLDMVTAAEVGGAPCDILYISDDHLELQITQAPSGTGWQEILLYYGGEEPVQESGVFLIADAEFYYDTVQMGNLQINGCDAALCGGELILGGSGMQISEAGYDPWSGALHLNLTGTVTIPADLLPTDYDLTSQLTLPGTGTLAIHGLLSVASGDSAYYNYCDSDVLRGSFLLEFGEASQFLSGEGGSQG